MLKTARPVNQNIKQIRRAAGLTIPPPGLVFGAYPSPYVAYAFAVSAVRRRRRSDLPGVFRFGGFILFRPCTRRAGRSFRTRTRRRIFRFSFG